jgi:hypothetical protein
LSGGCAPQSLAAAGPASLREWLREHGLQRFGTLFELHGVTAAMLPGLTDGDVAEMVPTSLAAATAPLLAALRGLRAPAALCA